MTILLPSDRQIISLRRLRRNAWAAIGLCILFRIAVAVAGPVPADNADFKLILLETRP